MGKIQLVKMEKDKRKVKGKGKRKGVKGRERRDLFSSPEVDGYENQVGKREGECKLGRE